MSYGNYAELPNETEYTEEELYYCQYCQAEIEEHQQWCDSWCEKGAMEEDRG